MKKLLGVLVLIGFVFAFGNVDAQWHESFTNPATPDANAKIKSDMTWQWWGWGTAVVQDGEMQLTGAQDPFGNITSWIQIDQSTDPNAVITPTNCEIYVKVKITTDGTEDNDDQFHVVVAVDPDFMSNLNVYTVASVPKDNAIGVFYFAENSTKAANVNPAIVYDQYYWEKIKFDGSTISVWVYPDGGAPADTADVQFTQTTVANPSPTLILVGAFNDDSSKVHIDEVYYNEEPPATSVSEKPTSIVTDYSLEQNYPNPFNPETTIKYSLKEEGKVSLKVFNSQGKMVANLVNGVLSAGSHEAHWNALNMPSGIYFYKLETTDFSQTKKMLLIK